MKVTVEVRGVETIGEVKLITEPLNKTLEVASTLSIETLADRKPYAAGMTNAHVCKLPSIETDLGDIVSS